MWPTDMADCGCRWFIRSPPAGCRRWHVVNEFLEEVLARGDVWFAPMEEIAAHVKTVADAGEYDPRVVRVPQYDGPVSPVPPHN